MTLTALIFWIVYANKQDVCNKRKLYIIPYLVTLMCKKLFLSKYKHTKLKLPSIYWSLIHSIGITGFVFVVDIVKVWSRSIGSFVKNKVLWSHKRSICERLLIRSNWIPLGWRFWEWLKADGLFRRLARRLARRRGLTGCGRAGAAMGDTSYSGGAIMEALALSCNHKRLKCRI